MAQTPPELHHLAATAAATPSGRPAGERIAGRFRAVALLGRGGLGEVWKCWDELLQDWVAIKVLHPHLQTEATAIRTLQAEVTGLRRLAHPHLVKVFDLHVDGATLALAMEWIDGPSLGGLAGQQPHGVLDPAEVVRIFTPLAEALDYAHAEGVLHRDIKPSNILIDPDGEPRLADFGLARQLRESLVRTSGFACVAGTLPYLSPQALYGDDPSPSDDLYAFALSIYECLAGRTPFYTGAIDLQIRERRPPPVSQVRTERAPLAAPLPPAWNRVLTQALGKNAADRPADARSLVAQLATALASPAAARKVERRRRLLAAGAVAAVAAVAVSLPPFLGRNSTPPAVVDPAPPMLATSDASAVPSTSPPAPPVATGPTGYAYPPGPTGLAGVDNLRLGGHLPMDGDLEGWMPDSVRSRTMGSLWPTADRDGQARGALAFTHSSLVVLENVWDGPAPATLTISFWFRLLATNGTLFNLDGDDGADPTYQLAIVNQYLAVAQGQTAIPTGLEIPDSPLLPTGVWHHVVFRVDQDAVRIDLNGEHSFRVSRLVPASDRDPRRLVIGGGSVTGVVPGFNGHFDDFRWYARSISDDHARSLALAPALPPPETNPPPVAADPASAPLYTLSGSTVHDTDDWLAAAQDEFGPNARPADWTEVKAAIAEHGYSVLEASGLPTGGTAFVLRDGESRFTASRTYNLSRNDGFMRDSALVHDFARGYKAYLASSPGQRLRLLVRLPGDQTAPWTLAFRDEVPAPWKVEGPAAQGRPLSWAVQPEAPVRWWADFARPPAHGLLTLEFVANFSFDNWTSGLMLASGSASTADLQTHLRVQRPSGRPGSLELEVPGSGLPPIELPYTRGAVRFQVSLGDGRVAVNLRSDVNGESILQQSWPLPGFEIERVTHLGLTASTDSPQGLTVADLRASGR